MNTQPNQRAADPPVETLRRIEPLCAKFEAAWKSGQQPRIEDYLNGVQDAERAVLLRELLMLDVDYRSNSGAPPTAAEYCPRFPDQVALIDGLLCEVSDAALGRTGDLTGSLGRFRILELLGRGAFGNVYKAYDPELDVTVAIKTPRGGAFESEEEKERFSREARSAAQLEHPGIVQVKHVGYEQGMPYIVSEYVEGVTLADLLTRGRPGFRETAQWIAQIADALDYAHSKKVIHRDIKPGNILIDAGGQPHVADFGLARREEAEITVTHDGQVLGTPAYMSPEQARGDRGNVDARSDVYSLGVVLYELLTGELPFRGSRQMLLSQVLNDEPRAPSSLSHDVPRDLETICLKAMAKKPGQRYQSARDLADDLRRWLNNEPIRARPVSRVERLGRWCRRKPLVASLSIGVVLSLFAGSCVSTYFAFQADRRAEDAVAARRRAEALAGERAKLVEAERTSRQQADTSRQDVERNLYFLRIAAADREWLADNVDAAEALLEACPPEYRHWEWYYLKQRCHPELFEVLPPQDWLMSDEEEQTSSSDTDALLIEFLWWHRFKQMEFSQDGKWLATVPVGMYSNAAGKPRLKVGKEIRLSDASTGKQRLCLQGHTSPVTCVNFSPDGKWLASGGYDGTVKVWDTATGRESHTRREHPGAVTQVVFSPNGRWLASVAPGQLSVWDVAHGGQPSRHLEKARFETARVAFSPDSKSVAAIFLNHCWWGPDSVVLDRFLGAWRGRGWMKVWETDTAKPILDVPGLGYANRRFLSNDCVDVAFSPEGTSIATLDSAGVSLWDYGSDKRRFTLRRRTRFSNGTAGADADPDESEESKPERCVLYEVTGEPAVGMAFAPDGRQIATTSENRAVRLWDATTGEEVGVLRLPSIGDDEWLPGEIAFSQDGKWLVALTHGRPGLADFKRWNTLTGEVIETIRGIGEAMRMTVSPDRRRIAFQNLDGTVRVYRTAGKTTTVTIGEREPRVETPGQGRREVLTSPDGKYEAKQDGGLADGEIPGINLWDVTQGKERCRLNAAGLAQSFSPDGKLLASMTSDCIIKLWDVTTGEQLYAVRPSIHYRFLAISNTLSSAPWRPKGAVGFSPDGKRIASSYPDGTLGLLDTATGREVLKLHGSELHWKSRVAFSADGRKILRGPEVWDAGPPPPIAKSK